MKIFYGCNGVGNGHITRTRLMARALYDIGVTDITFLFSGRTTQSYFDMEIFNDYRKVKGLNFVIENGKVNPLKTMFNVDLKTLRDDINAFDLSDYDLVISDYEPITAWAAKRQNKNCLGIGHQYAFNYDIPIAGGNFITKQIMKNFAPVSKGIGLHWQSCNQPIMPPIIDTDKLLHLSHLYQQYMTEDHILVYVPFENQEHVAKVLSKFKKHKFIVYAPLEVMPSRVMRHTYPNIEFKTPSKDGFLLDLVKSNGVICNAGFELISEALFLGKKILAKPLDGQMEQISNAKALKQFKYGRTMDTFNTIDIGEFLNQKGYVLVDYPDVAAILANAIGYGHIYVERNKWFNNVWRDVAVKRNF